MSEEQKQMLLNAKPIITYSRNGDTWTAEIQMEAFQREFSFKLGEEFVTKGLFNEDVKVCVQISFSK